MKLTITAAIGAQYVRRLRKHVQGAARILKAPCSQLSIALVNDKQMSKLHRQFMQIDGPTDVLTFPLEFDSRKRGTSGEIVICVPEARRRAKEMKVAVQNELLLYAVHGMLHLSGFDDRTRRGFRTMHEMEDRILRELGVGAVFAPHGMSKGRHEGTKPHRHGGGDE